MEQDNIEFLLFLKQVAELKSLGVSEDIAVKTLLQLDGVPMA